MRKILTATLAVAIALAPASSIAQGAITRQQSYVTGSKPNAEPGKYKVVKVVKLKKPKAVHRHQNSHKVAKAPPRKKVRVAHHQHSHRVAKAAHYAKHSYYRPRHHDHWYDHRDSHRHWLLPALVGTVIGLGLFHFWH